MYCIYILMRDAEGRKKEASKAIQTTRQSNTAHPRQSLFQRKMSCLGWNYNRRHSTLETCSMYMYIHVHVHLLYNYYVCIYIHVHVCLLSIIYVGLHRLRCCTNSIFDVCSVVFTDMAIASVYIGHPLLSSSPSLPPLCSDVSQSDMCQYFGAHQRRLSAAGGWPRPLSGLLYIM